jgi:hypothetical protein
MPKILPVQTFLPVKEKGAYTKSGKFIHELDDLDSGTSCFKA